MTERLLRAIENPNTSILGHPTGRQLLRRDAYPFDMDAVLKTAAKNKVAMELNSYPDRLDLNDVHLRQAKEQGVKIVINTDSHHTSHLEQDPLRDSAGTARMAHERRCSEYFACGEVRAGHEARVVERARRSSPR